MMRNWFRGVDLQNVPPCEKAEAHVHICAPQSQTPHKLGRTRSILHSGPRTLGTDICVPSAQENGDKIVSPASHPAGLDPL